MGPRTTTALGLALLAAVAHPVTADPASPIFSLVRPMLRLPPAAEAGIVEVLLQVVNPSKDTDRAGVPTLRDVSESAPEVTVSFLPGVALPSAAGSPRTFRFQATVGGLKSTGQTLVRSLQVDWNGEKASLPYWLSNTAAPVFNWNVSGLPAKWSLDGDGCHPLRLSPSGARATGIVVTSTLTERTTLAPLNELTLGVERKRQSSATASEIEAAVNDLGAPVYLCLPTNVRPGEYAGTVSISAAEKPEAGVTSVVVYASGWWYRLAGGGLLLLGCVLAFVARALLPARFSRNHALLSAALVREDAQKVLDGLDAAVAPKAAAALTRLLTTLEDNRIARFVPGAVPSLLGASHDAEGFKRLIEGASTRLAGLVLIVNGIGRAGSDAAKVADIDMLADDATLSNADLSSQIGVILKRPSPAAAPGQQVPPKPPVAEARSRELVAQIEKANARLWWVWGVISCATGFVVLVLNQPGFGVSVDYLYCVLWGFGVPLAGQQLTGATAGTALGVTFPQKPS